MEVAGGLLAFANTWSTARSFSANIVILLEECLDVLLERSIVDNPYRMIDIS